MTHNNKMGEESQLYLQPRQNQCLSTHSYFRMVFSEGALAYVSSLLESTESPICFLTAKISDADVVPSGTNIRVEFPIRASLALKDGLEQV